MNLTLYQIKYSYLDELDTTRQDEVVVYDRETILGELIDRYLDEGQYKKLDAILSENLGTTDEHVAYYLDRRNSSKANLTIEMQEAFGILVRNILLLEAS